MKKVFKKGLMFAFAAFIASAVMGIASDADALEIAVRDNPVIMPQTEIKQTTPVDESNAYIIFTDTAQEKQMSFEDGFGKTTLTDITYNEKINLKGIVGRKVYYQNIMYLRFDPSFCSPEDTTYKITFNYYDFGGAGYIHFDYTIPGTTDTYGRISVLKMGDPKGGTEEERYEKAKWWECTFYISDASFRQAMDYGGDIRIVTGGYNAFSKIEVTNLSRNAGEETFDLFNKKSANSLKVLGLFDEYSAENADTVLGKELTREEALKYIIQFAGLKEEAETKNLPCSFTDVSASYKPYVGMAESLGIVKNTTGTLGAQETFPQSELCEWYANFMGYEREDIKTNPLTVAASLNLINSGNMVFQPTKKVMIDNLVAFANNMLPLKNLKTEKCYLSDLYNSGRVTVDTFRETGDATLVNWLLMGEFYMPPEEHYDPETGRTYYTINLLGENAIKNYYTMPMTSYDDTRFYFRDKNSNIYEYNMKTYMVKYMCTGDPGIEHFFCLTAKNNLWYLDKYSRICKINLDTYEETVVVHLPDAYQDISLSTGVMLQVDFNETALTIGVRDARYWEIRDQGSTIHQYDIENNIWKNIFIGDFSKDYVTDYTYPGHLCQNPVYKNLVFYCHEGGGVNDRTWIMDMETGERWVGFKQKQFSPYRYGESGVHEYWLADGLHALTVSGNAYIDAIDFNWGPDHRKREAGIYFFRYDGKDRYLVNCDYQYSHCATALNSNRWLISDVGIDSANGFTKLVLMDTEAGWSKVIANHTKGNNPGHSHPQFSWDAKTAFFGLWSEDYKTVEVGWADISDLTSNPTPGSQIKLNEACSTYSYEGMDSFMIEKEDKDGKYWQVPVGNTMQVKVDCDYLEKESTSAEITVTYLDKGYYPIKIDYCEWENHATYSKRESGFTKEHYYEGIGKLNEKVVYLERKNTGKWVTESVTIHHMNLENMYKLGADFKISGVQSTAEIRDVFIKEVK